MDKILEGQVLFRKGLEELTDEVEEILIDVVADKEFLLQYGERD